MDEDLRLIDEVLNGNIDSFNILINKYETDILRYVYSIIRNKYAAEDVTQDIFIAVYNKLYTFGKGTKFSTCLFKTAKIRSMNFLKRYGMIPQADVEQPLNQIDFNQKLQQFIFALDETDLQIIILKYSTTGLSFTDIAKVMNMSEEVVRKRFYQVLDKFKYNEAEVKTEMQKCSNYTEVYGQEAVIDGVFKEALIRLNVRFSKIRTNVIKNIDKRKYDKGIIKKLFYHFIRHIKEYAAVILFTAFILNQNFCYAAGKKTDAGMPQFQKNVITKKVESEDIFNEKISPDSNTTVGIYGRADDGIEEGVGAIYISTRKGNKYLLSIKNNQEQITPKIAEWFDNSRLLVVVGNAYGTITKGGQLYLIDIDSLKVMPVYLTGSLKKEVTGIKKEASGYKLNLNVYDDDEYIKCHSEEVLLDYSHIASVFRRN